MIRRCAKAAVLLSVVTLASCGQSEIDDAAPARPHEDSRLTVAAVNYPLAYLAARVGGNQVSVVFPVPPDIDPALWSPRPEAIAKYQSADLILLNGAGYAKWVARVSLPSAKTIDTGAAFEDRLIPLTDAVTHTHGPRAEHSHDGVASTTWLDLTLALEQARAIAAALEAGRTDQAAAIRERMEKLEADLTELDARLQAAASALGDRPVLFSHPVYQYLKRRYSLNGRSLHWEPDAEPSERQWRELEKLLDEHPAKWIVWEAEPLPRVARRLEELGVKSVVFSPCANRVVGGDFLSEVRANVDRLEAAW